MIRALGIAEYQAAPEKTKKEWGEAYAKPLEEYEKAIEEKKAPPKTVALDPSTGIVTVQANGTGPVPTIKSSPNGDIQVMLIMGLLSLAFVCIPFLPGVRDLPRKLPIYKLIWREHYRSQQRV